MKQEDKELLLKDLCARLLYGVKIQVKEWTTLDTDLKIGHIQRLQNDEIELKPYLRPMSSMTEVEIAEFKWLNNKCETMSTFEYVPIENYRIFDWLNRYHFDFRNLIKRGLAIDCTNLNIY